MYIKIVTVIISFFSVLSLYAQPKAYFDVSTKNGNAPLKIELTNLSENAINYVWKVNGKTFTEKNPVLVFYKEGKYKLTLIATDENGKSDTKHKNIQVLPKTETTFKQINGIKVIESDNTKYITDIKTDNDSAKTAFRQWQSKIKQYDETEMFVDTTRYIRNFILFPNAFRPEKSGAIGGVYQLGTYNNNVFHPTADQDIDEYRLQIYNRYGYLLFESDDINIGWDGYYNNRLMPQDGYFWIANGRFVTSGMQFNKWGHMVLLH